MTEVLQAEKGKYKFQLKTIKRWSGGGMLLSFLIIMKFSKVIDVKII